MLHSAIAGFQFGFDVENKEIVMPWNVYEANDKKAHDNYCKKFILLKYLQMKMSFKCYFFGNEVI